MSHLSIHSSSNSLAGRCQILLHVTENYFTTAVAKRLLGCRQQLNGPPASSTVEGQQANVGDAPPHARSRVPRAVALLEHENPIRYYDMSSHISGVPEDVLCI